MINNAYYLIKISTDGTVGLFKTKKTPELQQLYDLIGCDCVETILIDNDVLMLVDESGWLKDDPVPNFKASVLYSDTAASIAGNVVLLKLNRQACDWKALTFDEAAGLLIEIEAREETYIHDKLMQI